MYRVDALVHGWAGNILRVSRGAISSHSINLHPPYYLHCFHSTAPVAQCCVDEGQNTVRKAKMLYDTYYKYLTIRAAAYVWSFTDEGIVSRMRSDIRF